jgi:hypothetical protein
VFSLCIREQNSLAEGIPETCTTQGCKTKPNYNYEGQAKADVHKKDVMVDVKKGYNQIAVAVKSAGNPMIEKIRELQAENKVCKDIYFEQQRENMDLKMDALKAEAKMVTLEAELKRM